MSTTQTPREAADRLGPHVSAIGPKPERPEPQQSSWRDWLPHPVHNHIMALAPLDVWVRLLFFPLAKIGLRYWPRLFYCLVLSTIATAVTLPERILWAIWERFRPFKPAKLPGVVFVLGHYRSGTTHLHYLLNCDPQFYTPRWYHALVPQGFVVSWTAFRWLMLPFVVGRRPMDGVGVGPEYPAEDQFGVNNWSLASSLPCMTVLPQMREFYERFHELENLSPEELHRWRRYQAAFIRKLAAVSGGRQLLLKSPNHTAHVRELILLLKDCPNVRFVHITRHPHKVMQSNVMMHEALQSIWNLQDQAPRRELEEALCDEFIESEERYLDQRELIPPGRLCELRAQDLNADPMSEIRRIYDELGLEYTPEFETRLLEYLGDVRDYRANTHEAWTPEQRARLAPRLDPLIEKFHHDRPARPKRPAPLPPVATEEETSAQRRRAAVSALGAALACCLFWLPIAAWLGADHVGEINRLLWPTGVVIGIAASRCMPGGSKRLGAWCAALTVGVALLYNGLYPWLLNGAVPAGPSGLAALDLLWKHLGNLHTLVWGGMGVACAYFTAARPRIR